MRESERERVVSMNVDNIPRQGHKCRLHTKTQEKTMNVHCVPREGHECTLCTKIGP